MSPRSSLHHMWRWYWALWIANALDLLFTYVAADRGIGELNRILAPILLTPWPLVLKVLFLALLGSGLTLVIPAGPRPARMLRLVRVTAVVYLGLVGFHLLGLALTG
ncbi:MAG: DUF5658 family protein [bacterium]